MDESPLPVPQGPRLTAEDELLFRQVHPDMTQNGRPTSAAFKPSKKDQGLLSVSRGALTTAPEAYARFTSPRSSGAVLRSAGVWGVTVAETALPCFSDPVGAPDPDPAHAVVSFQSLSNKQLEDSARRLQQAALTRGRLYP